MKAESIIARSEIGSANDVPCPNCPPIPVNLCARCAELVKLEEERREAVAARVKERTGTPRTSRPATLKGRPALAEAFRLVQELSLTLQAESEASNADTTSVASRRPRERQSGFVARID